MLRSNTMISDAWVRQNFYLLAGLLTLVALCMRLYQIEFQSLWLNEIDSWFISHRTDLSAIINRDVMVDPHPPGYNILMHFVIQWFGSSEVAIRMPSVIAGTLSVFLMALLGRRLFDPATGLIAAALFCVLWAPMYYSQDGRAYSLLMMMTILSTYMLLRAIDVMEARWRTAWPVLSGYVLSAVAVTYLHYFGLLIIGVHGLILLIRVGVKMRAALLMAVVAICFVPWVPFMLEDAGMDHWIGKPDAKKIFRLLSFYFNQSDALYLLVFLPLQYWAVATCVQQLRHGKSDWRDDPTVLVLIWICVPIGIALAKSLVSQPVWNYRNLLICAPAFVLLTARGMTALRFRPSMNAAIVTMVPLIALLHLLFEMEYYERPTKGSFREISKFIVDTDPQGDVPLVSIRHLHYYDYYFIRYGSDRRTDLAISFAEDADELKAFAKTAPNQTFWLLEAGHVAIARGGLRDILASDFEMIERHEEARGRATLYRLK